MKADTKIYSNFIKANNIKVTHTDFTYNGQTYGLLKETGGYMVEYPDGSFNQNGLYNTKKSAIYFTIKNL